MMYRFEAWRRRLQLWTIPLVFCLLNLAGVMIYRASFAGDVEARQQRVERASQKLAELEAERQTSIEFLESLDRRREAMKLLYEQHFVTESERLTAVIKEAKNLAREAGLKPKTITYPETPLGDWNLIQKQIVFPVEGTYDQLRTFMNFLELTEQFLTLERVSLGEGRDEGQNPILSIQLELSTIFVDEAGAAGGRS